MKQASIVLAFVYFIISILVAIKLVIVNEELSVKKSEADALKIKIDEAILINEANEKVFNLQNNAIKEFQKERELMEEKMKTLASKIPETRVVYRDRIKTLNSEKVGDSCEDAMNWLIEKSKELADNSINYNLSTDSQLKAGLNSDFKNQIGLSLK